MNHFGSQNYKTVGMQESTHFLSPTEKQLFCICFRFSSGDVSILTFFNSREGDLPAASLAADLSHPPVSLDHRNVTHVRSQGIRNRTLVTEGSFFFPIF